MQVLQHPLQRRGICHRNDEELVSARRATRSTTRNWRFLVKPIRRHCSRIRVKQCEWGSMTLWGSSIGRTVLVAPALLYGIFAMREGSVQAQRAQPSVPEYRVD